jgi:hypothetical protein
MSGTIPANNASGGWKQRLLAIPLLGRGLRLLRIPFKVERFVDGAGVVHTPLQDQYDKLRDGNTALYRLLADMLPKLHQDVQAGQREIARMASEALPEMQTAAVASREEVKRLKHRYAEFYGAIVEQLRDQNRRLDQLTDQQDRILQLLSGASAVLPLEQKSMQLPKAG